MRVCPECGHIDPPEWRHSRYSYWIDFCLKEDFVKMHPKLAKELLSGEKMVEDKNYVYRKTKNDRRVERKALVDYGYQWIIPMERVHGLLGKHHDTDFRKCWNRPPKNQKKLFEMVKK